MRKFGTAGLTALLALFILLSTGSPAGAIFDDYDPSPRSRAMGGGWAAVADDGCALFYNPAGLGQQSDYQLFTSYYRPYGLDFLEYNAGSATIPLPKFGVVGVGFQKFGVTYEGQDLQNEKTFSLSHGITVMEDVHSSLSLGYTFHMYSLDLGTSLDEQSLGSDQTLGVDAGILAVLRNRTRMGAVMRNFNRPRMGTGYREDLPRYMTFGIAYQPYPDVITSLEMDKKFGQETRLKGGMEAQIVPLVALRFGVQTKPDRLMGGLGLSYRGVQFDYALINHSVLPLTHQLSISYRFGGK